MRVPWIVPGHPVPSLTMRIWSRPFIFFLAFMLVLGVGTRSSAFAQSSDESSPHSEGTLISETSAIPPGASVTVALHLEMEEGWHSYWKNPGDSGERTTIEWTLPEGLEAGSIQWPYPERIPFGPMVSYGYSDEVLLPVSITASDTLTPGRTVAIEGRAEWLICEEICLPAHDSVTYTLEVGDEPVPTSWSEAIAEVRSEQPRTLDGWSVRAAQSSGSYTLALTPPKDHDPDLDGAYFFPEKQAVLDHAAPQPMSRAGDTYLFTLQQSSYAEEPVRQLQGVFVGPEGTTLTSEEDLRAMRVDVSVDSTLSDIDVASLSAPSTGTDGSGLSLPLALLFAFAGGLLLNLMPCVFPVISVKILGFVEEAGGDHGTIRQHGVLFGVGVLVSMWILAGVLLGIRAAGSQVGWGFQLQSPTFIALMALLFFGIGLNLLGVFEVGTRIMNWGGRLQTEATQKGNVGAFLTGVLATVVATPCTAPFMGAALGLALTLSTLGALLVFTVLGVGMATPYVGLSMMPSLLDRLPDPGAWMVTLKQFFAFPMFATAIWLVWVFGQQTGNGGVALLLFGLLLLGMAGWILHRWSTPQLSRGVTLVTRGLVTLMVVGAVAAGVIGAGYDGAAGATSTTDDGGTNSSDGTTEWMEYSPSTVEDLRADGRPVFVDFTAAWCLTCQVNERTVLNTDAVQQAFAERDVALVKADWTNRDPDITEALESHGRSGVPVYVLYPGDGSGPTLLPEVLTTDIVLDALEAVPSSSS